MLVLRLVLPKRAVAFQQLVDHATEAEPIGAAVITHPFTKNLGRHVAVRSDTRMRLLFAVE